MLAIVVALLPVLAFLALLVALDSFKLVAPARLARAAAAGGAVALACLPVNAWMMAGSADAHLLTSRYFAPLLEESLKAGVVAVIVWRRGAGFLVDAAILGFAVGAGFALVENVHYLWALRGSGAGLWIVRGFGTAILHGATAAIAAILTQHLLERRERRRPADLAPGWVAAFALHSAFNHFVLPPAAATLLLLVALPPLVLIVFERSERATRSWVNDGMDVDLEAMGLLLSTGFAQSRAGRYLQELKARFPGPVVADMFCLLRIDLELAIRAKGILMAREAGLELPADETISARLEERRYLRHAIGPTGLLALRPLQPQRARDGWHELVLREASRRPA